MSALQPVSFKKGRQHTPRLSAPYVPGKHSERYWTDEQDNILREHYPEKGHPYCASRLENKSKMSIYARAHTLGLKFKGGQKNVRKHDYKDLDAEIQKLWPDFEKPHGTVSGVKALAAQLGRPHWMISARCRHLGLTIAHKKEPPWTPAEEALLQHVPRHDAEKSSEIFKAHGFNRSPTAIMIRCKRVGLSRRFREAFSATAAAKIVGMDSKTIACYCIDGTIKATRRPTKRTPQQGGDWHLIAPTDLRQFVIEHIGRIDFRRVDKYAMVELLTGPASTKNGTYE